MRLSFSALFGFALLGTAALADEPRNPAIEGVIQRQLDAFVADDLGTAFTYASPMIKGIFGTPDNFGMMVRQGYPMVWRPGAVKFGALRNVAGALWQTVVITDQAGAVHVLEYQMDPAEGGWQIDGVQLQRAPQVGA